MFFCFVKNIENSRYKSYLPNQGLRFDKVNLKNVSENVISLILPMLNGKKITVINNISEDIVVSGDENKIQQIFYNLIGNAIKFTDSGTITLKTQVINNMVEVRVIDTGLGIAKENFDKIFKSFEQVDGADTRKYGGIGLGLSITKDLVELHGGTIVVDSEIDKGSSFIFTLKREEWLGEVSAEKKIKNPIFPFDNNMFETEKQEKGNFVKGKILIVDDEPVNLVVLNDYLVLKGYDVISASNGEDVLKIINKNIGIELVILDVMMPKMSGYEVCKILRESYSSYSLPVLMVTAKGRTEDIVAGFESGANDYLTKPVEAKELYARVGTLIALRGAVNSSIELEVKYEREKREKEFVEKMKKQTEDNLIKIGA